MSLLFARRSSRKIAPSAASGNGQLSRLHPRAALKNAAMLVLDDISVRVAGRLLLDGASARIPEGARVGLVGRNGIGKTTLFRAIVGRDRRRARHHRHALARAHRAPRAGGAGRSGKPDRGRARAPTASAPSLLAEAETAHDPHRIAEIQTRLADIGAHAAPARAAVDPRRPRLRCRRAAAPVLGFLRRLAHARRARGGAVLRAGSAAARRADQLSRSRRHAVADRPPRALSAHRDRHQPRPRPARRRGRLDPAHRRRQARALSRRLYVVRAPARRASGAQCRGGEEAGGRAQAPAGLRRPLQGEGHQGAAGAIAREEAREARADRGDRERRCAADRRFRPPAKPLSPPIIALDRVSVGYEPGKPVLRRLNLRIDTDDRIALLGAERQRQVDPREAARRPARAVRRDGHAARSHRGRVFRAAPARRTRSRRKASTITCAG